VVLCGAPCLRVLDDTVLWYAAWVRAPMGSVIHFELFACDSLSAAASAACSTDRCDHTCVELDA
jgi:hypothetical protein